MNDVINVLTQNILPIFIVAAFGFGLRRFLKLDKKTLSGAVFNVLSPCLVFSSLLNTNLPPVEVMDLVLFTVLVIGVMGLIGIIVAKPLKLTRREMSSFLILIMFVNHGNFGLTLLNLRYGEEGLARGIVYYTTSTILLFTIGLFIASRGELSGKESISRLVRIPAVYAVLLAVIFSFLRLRPPEPLMKAIEIAGSGAIPVMLLVLGMQMADLKGGINFRLAVPTISIRLLIGPIVGFLIATFLGLQGLSFNAAVIEASMPPAVITIILATEFGLPAPAVTSIVVVATLISPLTIAATIGLLGL